MCKKPFHISSLALNLELKAPVDNLGYNMFQCVESIHRHLAILYCIALPPLDNTIYRFKTLVAKLYMCLGVIQQLRGQNFAIF